MTKSIKIITDNLTGSAAPLYFQYGGQCQPQPAYIEIDPRGDEITVTADYDGNIGGGCSSDQWYNLTCSISCPGGVLGSALISHLESDDFKKDVLELCDGYEDIHNGSNWIGTWNEDARDIDQSMENDLHCLECAEVYDGDEWISDSVNFFDEDGEPCDYAYQAKTATFDKIKITTENLDSLVSDAESYIDENLQLVIGTRDAFESIIEEME